jgi:hypothetical protein
MLKQTVLCACLGGFLYAGIAGCSGTGAAMTGAQLGLNLSKNDTHLRIFLDDVKAAQNTAKKAATGYSEWKIKEPMSTEPKLKFEITKPEKLGRITMVAVAIFQQYEADYSHQAEYTIVAKDTNNPAAQMKPATEYDLGKPGADFKVMDLTSKEVDGVHLKPGLKYKLVLTVRADKSETAQIEFKTK